MKIITVGANDLFPEFPLSEQVQFDLSRVTAGNPMHILTFNGVEYLFELKDTWFISTDEILVTGFIVDDRQERRVGKISFVFFS